MSSRASDPGFIESPGENEIDDRSWAIYVAYTQQDLTCGQIAKAYHLSTHQVRRILRRVAAETRRPPAEDPDVLETASPLEALPIPVRTRNALRGVGCQTIADILNLDLTSSIRGLGSKSKEQLLAQLSRAG